MVSSIIRTNFKNHSFFIKNLKYDESMILIARGKQLLAF